MTSHRLAAAMSAALVLLGAVTVPALAAGEDSPRSAGASVGLPAGVPDAARRAEPVLPAPPAWPFGEEFSRTSGTGRMAGGASFWTDFLYDDHGATDPLAFPVNLLTSVSKFAPTQGSYRYPGGPASGNGADVFRSAVGLDDAATYWRVDWNTLVDPAVPLAVWGIDLDGDASTGGTAWPASAGVLSPGQDRFLVVSSRGARLLDGTGTQVADLPTAVDLPSRSFVVRVPRDLLDVEGTSTLRLVAGLADPTGTALAQPLTTTGAPAPGTRVYNASFRSIADEPPVFGEGTAASAQLAGAVAGLLSAPPLAQFGLDGLARVVTGNFWMEDHQAEALANGDVTPFAEPVDWSALRAGRTEPEPRPAGYSNRWYVTDRNLGQGVVPPDPTMPFGDLRPNFLSRVQPYAVHVPAGVEDGAPLTWVLHSLDVNHNQYGGLDPQLLAELCDDRGSICATTLGHGPDGWYFDEAEADFWQVWREVAETYRTSTEHTVLTGFSMGGYAAYKLGLAHPDLFATAVSLAGPPSCGVQLVDGLLVPATVSDPSSRCAADGATTPLLENGRWVPYVVAHGALDQLVPVTSVLERVQQLDELGYRHQFTLYPAEDHLAYATQDRFGTEVAGIGGTPARAVDPGHVTYAWYPRLDDERLGIGATTAYWLSGLQAADAAPGQVARVDARSLAIPDPAVEVTRTGPTPMAAPLPGTVTTLGWTVGATPPGRNELELQLSGVSALTVDAARAGLDCGATVRTTSDRPTTLTLAGLRSAPVAVPAGQGVLEVACDGVVTAAAAAASTPVVAGRAAPRLADTGAGPTAVAGIALLAVAAAVRRRS